MLPPRRRRPGLRPALRRARRRMERADPAEAAAILEEKAQTAEEQGLSDRAGDLHLEAARCYLQLEDIDRADDHGLKALQLFIQARRPGKVRRLVPRMMAVLRRKGYHDEAEKLHQEVDALLGALPGEKAILWSERAVQRGSLPAKCPSCGGPIRSDEVNWIDSYSAECAYCGGIVKAT
jgi:tetratricopeptide (TPR) repeat protein